jgi:uncharacterized membrane protein
MYNSLDLILAGIGIIAIVGYLCLFFYYLFKDRPKFVALIILTVIYIFLAFLYTALVFVADKYITQNSGFSSLLGVIGLFLIVILANVVSGNRLMSWYANIEQTLGKRN